MPKIFMIACEASGDSHGAYLVEAIKRLNPGVAFEGLGGEAMKKAGVRLLEETTHESVLGFGDVIRKYFHFRKIFYRALAWVEKTKPDLLILIDSPAFNLRFAKKIKRRIPIFYYIAPQIWAWGARRIHTIRKTVNHVIVILPFEKEIYQKAGIPCTFVGHPLLDRVKPTRSRASLRQEFSMSESERALVLLPGSREPEVRRIFPIMMESARLVQKKARELKWILIQAPHVSPSVYDEILKVYPDLPLKRTLDRLYDWVHAADFAWVASGTATLETALLGTPYLLFYKASASTFFLGRRLVRIPYLGLVNVLAGRHVIREFIQHLAKPKTIAEETIKLLENGESREKLRRELSEVCQKLGEPGATERAARLIVSNLSINPFRPPAS